jgi:hypothetical protein
MRNKTKTISLFLNFNDENQYHFAVEISQRVYTDETYCLTGVNSIGKKFQLGRLGKALMRLLVELDHATKKRKYNWYESEYWRIHAPRKMRQMAAVHAGVSPVKEVDRSAEVSAPAASVALPDGNVVQFSPKAK